MSPSLEDPRLKLRRAREHLESLEGMLDAFSHSETKRISEEFNVDTGCKDFWLDPTPAPAEWGPIVGDTLYNCRSALDHLANQLAGAHTNDRTTCWPIIIEPGDWEGKGEPYVQRMADEAQALVKSTQPYNRPHKHPRNDVFAILSGLSNADKHRHLHIGVVSLRSLGYWGDLDLREFFGGLVEHRTKMASVGVAGPEVHVPLQFSLHVAFAHYTRWRMPLEVIRFFHDITSEIERLFAEVVRRGLLPA